MRNGGSAMLPEKNRYIVAYRFGPRPDPRSIAALTEFVRACSEACLVRRTAAGRHILDLTHQQMRDFCARHDDFVVESDQELKPWRMPGLPPIASNGGSSVLRIVVRDAFSGEPVPRAMIYGTGAGPAYRSCTDANGSALLEYSDDRLTMVTVCPIETHWSRVVRDFDSQKTLDVSVKPLLTNGAYNWGHRLMGFDDVNGLWTGKDVRVGIIGSGTSDQHPWLQPAGGINAIVGHDANTWNIDETGHGTHCAGVIAASDDGRGIRGGAPGTQVFSIKISPGGTLSDLIEALEWCVSNRMDIVNITVETTGPSLILAHALRDSYEHGITCIAPAGDDHGMISWPAAVPTVIGVGAIGRVGTFPEDSAHQLQVSRIMDYRGKLFAANFTNVGHGVDVCAPGVAVLSTVPSGYACRDGTATASSLITSLTALLLDAYPAIRTGKSSQVDHVRSILHCAAIPLGMPAYIEGRGLPLAPLALGAARYSRSVIAASPAVSADAQSMRLWRRAKPHIVNDGPPLHLVHAN